MLSLFGVELYLSLSLLWEGFAGVIIFPTLAAIEMATNIAKGKNGYKYCV